MKKFLKNSILIGFLAGINGFLWFRYHQIDQVELPPIGFLCQCIYFDYQVGHEISISVNTNLILWNDKQLESYLQTQFNLYSMNELEIACCFELVVMENPDLSKADLLRILNAVIKVNKRYHFYELLK